MKTVEKRKAVNPFSPVLAFDYLYVKTRESFPAIISPVKHAVMRFTRTLPPHSALSLADAKSVNSQRLKPTETR